MPGILLGVSPDAPVRPVVGGVTDTATIAQNVGGLVQAASASMTNIGNGAQRVGGLVQAANVWDPSQLSNLVLWLLASDNITLNGSNVSAWGSREGGSHSYAQATGAAQPAYSAGPPSLVTTNKTSTYLTNDDTELGNSSFTVAWKGRFVAVPTSGSVGFLYYFKMTSTTFFALCGVNTLAPYQPWSFCAKVGNATSVGVNQTIDTSTHRVIITYNNGTNTSTGSYQFFLDGASQTIATSGTFNVATTNHGAIGGSVSNVPALSQGANAEHRALIAYTRVLSGSEITLLDNYLIGQ